MTRPERTARTIALCWWARDVAARNRHMRGRWQVYFHYGHYIDRFLEGLP